MKKYLLLLASFGMAWLGCSQMESSKVQDTHSLLNNQRYQIKVRTGNNAMDSIVYEYAYKHFSKVLPVVEKEPYTGSIDVTFGSSADGYYVGTTTSYSTTNANATAWYTGGNSAVAYGSSSTNTTGVTTGSAVTWQNSTMLVVVRDSAGNRLWTADYKYKGGWEMSGFVVNTAQEAANLCCKRVAEKLKKDIK